jgi:hypothetical protein
MRNVLIWLKLYLRNIATNPPDRMGRNTKAQIPKAFGAQKALV